MSVIRLPSPRNSVQDEGRGRNSYTPYTHSKPPGRDSGYHASLAKQRTVVSVYSPSLLGSKKSLLEL